MSHQYAFFVSLMFGFLAILSHQATTWKDALNEEKITVHVALRPNNVDVLEHIVNDISNPNSPAYGSYLSVDQINDLVRLNNSELARIKDWFLRSPEINDRTTVQLYADAVRITGPKSSMYRMFRPGNGTFYVPESVRDLVVFVTGLEDRNVSRPNTIRFADDSVDPGIVGREVFQRLYDIPETLVSHKTSIGAMEYEGTSGFSEKDIVTCQQDNSVPNNPVPRSQIIGVDHFPDTESQLDVQMIAQVAANGSFWYEDYKGWMYSWVVDFFNRKDIPYIVSLSWGWNEAEQCSITTCTNETSKQYVDRTNYEFMKLAARGVTIVVASGDAGSPGRTNEYCSGENNMNPVFPGSSKWVTSVGATYLLEEANLPQEYESPLCKQMACANGTIEQVVWNPAVGWTSGSGFDNYASTPSWQAPEVLEYVNSGVPLPDQQHWNRYGRAYPDVSAIGHNCAVWSGYSGWGTVDGTSCSAPVFASVLAILNDHQVNKGRPRLGFVNPLLYQMYREQHNTFTDITVGNSSCTEAACCGPQYGFVAGEGWDPVAGLGTPRVGNMLRYLDTKFQ